MVRTEAQVLAEMMDKTRQLTRFYISQLKSVDPYQPVELGGKTFNSLYWLTAHIVWAEDNLLITGTGATTVAPSWINHYAIAGDGTLHPAHGEYKALLDEMKRVHERALAQINSLSAEELDLDNTLNLQFGGDGSKRMAIMHAVRHEGTHIGNLAWLCKMAGIKSV